MKEILDMLKSKFSRKEYRDSYVKSNIPSQLSHQLRIIRESRGLTQAELAKLIGTKESVISQLEDSSFRSHNLSTLVSIANALDIAVSVKFQTFGDYIKELEEWTPSGAAACGFDEEVRRIENNIESTANESAAAPSIS